jgi:hypothetical protein
MKAVESWAEIGLRTLVLAKREIKAEFYQKWVKEL